MDLILGLPSLGSLLTAIISLSNGWTWGILLGLSIWCALMPLSQIAYFGRALSATINEFQESSRYRDVLVPQVAVDAAARFGISPPEGAKVIPGLGFNAMINKHFLFMTEGLRAASWLRMATGIMAHEMAHLARKHDRQRTIATSGLVVCVLVFTGTISEDFSSSTILLVMLSIGLTVWPVFSTRVHYHQEFDADRQAAKIVGVDTMTHTLKAMADRSLWKVNSDTHPSVEKRLARLEKERTNEVIPRSS